MSGANDDRPVLTASSDVPHDWTAQATSWRQSLIALCLHTPSRLMPQAGRPPTRCPLYDDDAVVTTTDLGSDQATHQLDSPHRLPRHLLQPGRQLPGVHVPRDGGQWTRNMHKLPGCHRTRPRRTPPDKPARARSPTTIPAVNIAIWGRC